jgi:hypothetical protein
LANRLSEAQGTVEETNARHLDSGILHYSRVLLAFLQGDQATLQELWAGPDGNRAGNPLFLLEMGNVGSYYGHARARSTAKPRPNTPNCAKGHAENEEKLDAEPSSKPVMAVIAIREGFDNLLGDGH